MIRQRFLTVCHFHWENKFPESLTKTLTEKKNKQENDASQMDIVFVTKLKKDSYLLFL